MTAMPNPLPSRTEAERSRMRHTSPGEAARDEERKARVAGQRMTAHVRKVLAGGDRLEAVWDAAMSRFAPGLGLSLSKPVQVSASLTAVGWDVLLDAIEEHGGGFVGEDRAALQKVLTDDSRLAKLPRGSAAHLAAAFAVLGARAETMEEAERFQAIVGRWMVEGWK